MRMKNPNEGDTRGVTKFLFFPLTLEKETRWLEFATYTEQYKKVYVPDDSILDNWELMWTPQYWGTPRCSHGYENWDECPDCGH